MTKNFSWRSFQYIALLFLIFAPALLFAQSVTPRYHGYGLPDQASTYASKIDALFNFILWMTGIVFFLVEGLLIIFLVKYRHKEGRKAFYTHGNNTLEITWTVIPALILCFLAIFSNSLWSEIRSPEKFPKDAAAIEIHPRQFEWDITYPGPDGKFGTPDDISTINELYLAVGKPAKIKLEAQDVIHSFFVPEFRIRQDAVPGMPTAVWIQPTVAGDYEIACSQLCGLGHYRMKGNVHVVSQDSVDSWMRSQAAPPPVAQPLAAVVPTGDSAAAK